MKKYLLVAVVLVMGTGEARASVVDFLVEPNDSVASAYTGISGSFGIYVSVSTGDNGGLVSYQFTLNAGVVNTTQGAYNTTPYTTYKKSKSPVSTDEPAGFDSLRSADTALQQSASQEITRANYIPVYGYGQVAVDLDSAEVATAAGAGYSNASVGIFPDPSTNPSTAPMLLFAGVPLASFHGTSPSSYFDTSLATNFAASVYAANGNPTVVPATTIFPTPTPEPASLSLIAACVAILVGRRRKQH